MICILLISFSSFYSCGEEIDGIVATIDGESFTANNSIAFSLNSSDILTITGFEDTTHLSFSVVYGGEGNYDVSEFPLLINYFQGPTDSIYYNGVSGNIEISSFSDDNVQGTFDFVIRQVDDDGNVLDEIDVEDGEFNITQ